MLVAEIEVIRARIVEVDRIAASLLLRRPGLLRRAVLFRAMVPFEPESAAGLHGARVFMSSGRNDPVAPAASAERLAALLRAAGADVTLRWDEAGHTLPPEALRAARDWLQRD